MPLCAKQLSTLKSIYTLQYAFLHWFLKVRQPFSGKCTSWIRQNTVSLLQKQRWYLPRKKKIATSCYKTAGSHKAIPLFAHDCPAGLSALWQPWEHFPQLEREEYNSSVLFNFSLYIYLVKQTTVLLQNCTIWYLESK